MYVVKQRISIIDELEGKQDYSLTIAVVDIDEKTEIEMNVFLNNQSAMGNFDADLLGNILQMPDIDFRSLGFDDLDLELSFGDNSKVQNAIEQKKETIFDDQKDAAKNDIEKIKEMKEARKKYKEKASEIDNAEFYLVVVFQSQRSAEIFQRNLGYGTDKRYIDGEQLIDKLGFKKEERQEPQAKDS